MLRLLKVLDMYYATSVKNETSQVYSQTGEYYSGGEISFLEQDRVFDPNLLVLLVASSILAIILFFIFTSI